MRDVGCPWVWCVHIFLSVCCVSDNKIKLTNTWKAHGKSVHNRLFRRIVSVVDGMDKKKDTCISIYNALPESDK